MGSEDTAAPPAALAFAGTDAGRQPGALCRRSLRLKEMNIRPPRPPSPGSPSASTSDSNPLLIEGDSGSFTPVRASYSALPPPATPSNPAAAHAAQRIQRAWRNYRTLSARSFCELGGEAVRLVQHFLSCGDVFQQRAASAAHLVLHFDVNKTILISDAAKGANQADMINILLSECAWGRMTEGPTWVPVGRLATDRPEADLQLMTYRNFLDSFRYPLAVGTTEEAVAENTRRRRLCSELQRVFTRPGEPGAMFSGVAEALSAALTVQAPGPGAADGACGKLVSGQRHILPSFFELLLHLQRTRRRFTLVFRTFGSDVLDVIEELNLFATSRHPAYPGVRMDGSDGWADVRLDVPGATGAHVRCALELSSEP